MLESKSPRETEDALFEAMRAFDEGVKTKSTTKNVQIPLIKPIEKLELEIPLPPPPATPITAPTPVVESEDGLEAIERDMHMRGRAMRIDETPEEYEAERKASWAKIKTAKDSARATPPVPTPAPVNPTTTSFLSDLKKIPSEFTKIVRDNAKKITAIGTTGAVLLGGSFAVKEFRKGRGDTKEGKDTPPAKMETFKKDDTKKPAGTFTVPTNLPPTTAPEATNTTPALTEAQIRAKLQAEFDVKLAQQKIAHSNKLFQATNVVSAPIVVQKTPLEVAQDLVIEVKEAMASKTPISGDKVRAFYAAELLIEKAEKAAKLEEMKLKQ